MWAQNWRAIAKFTLPYPNKNGVDIAKEMVKQVRFLFLVIFIFSIVKLTITVMYVILI